MARRRWETIVVILAVATVLGTQIPRITLDNSVEGFLHDDDPILLDYNALRDQFGRDDVTVIAIEPRRVFDFDFLGQLRALHRDLEKEVPHVDEVTSLINARLTRGEEDVLIVGDLLEDFPRDAAELVALRERVLANPLYLDTLISRDGHLTTVIIKPVTYSSGFSSAQGDERVGGSGDLGQKVDGGPNRARYLTDLESAELVKAVRAVIRRYERPDIRMYLAGTSVLEERLVDEMQADLSRFLILSTFIIVAVLYVAFRRISGVLLPLTTVGLSLVATFGLMALLEIPLSLTTEVLPPFLMTVGVCDSVHILAIFFQRIGRGDTRPDAIAYALGHSGLAVVMTSVTTAGGLFSFVWAEVAPVSELGIVGPLGVLLAMVFSLVALPALLAVGPAVAGGRSGSHSNARVRRLLVAVGRLCTRRPWSTVAAAALVLIIAGCGATRLRFANDYFLWFPEDEPLRVATELIDREMGGVVSLEMVVKTGEENGLYDPDLLRRIENLALANQSLRHGEFFIGKTTSVVDVLKEIHQALNSNRREFYTLPDEKRLIAQELLLFENSGTDDLEDVVDMTYSQARISMKVPWADWMLYPRFLEHMERHVHRFVGEEVEVVLTGFISVMARAAASFSVTMARSYITALIVITPLMIMLLGSLKRGLLSMIPNLAPVLVTLGVMGWLGIPLDMSTLLIGGIIIGLAVDDTIHFMHRFDSYYRETQDPEQAVAETLETTGEAMLFTSIVLVAGFLVFTFAYMSNIVAFGMLSALAAAVALAADVTLGPALMVLMSRGVVAEDSIRTAKKA